MNEVDHWRGRALAAEKRLEELESGQHILHLDEEDNWSLVHPLSCRENGDLLDCPVHQKVSLIRPHQRPAPGRYSVDYTDDKLSLHSL